MTLKKKVWWLEWEKKLRIKKETQSQSIVFPLGSFIVKKQHMLGFLIN
jgi:hypothetical protein